MSKLSPRPAAGFTLVELLVAMLLFGILMTLAVPALKHYLELQTLNGDRDDLVGHLREVQQRVVSESHPLVYGVRFHPASSATSSSTTYDVIKYDPGSNLASTGDDTCSLDPNVSYSMSGGAYISSATFDAAQTPVVLSKCPTVTAGDKFVFFYARGTATAGSVTLTLPSIGNRTITVTGLTARVDG